MKQKYAKLIVTKKGNDVLYTIRSGRKGKGKILYVVHGWDNPKSSELTERYLKEYCKRYNVHLTQ